MIKLLLLTSATLLCFSLTLQAGERRRINPEAKQFKYSTTIEKERPELNEETKCLIAAYRQNPTQENYNALRRQAEINYDKVVERKKAKLAELKQTAREISKVTEMQVIVDEMLKDRENRINQTMNRFTDPRLRPNARQTTDGYLPVLGAAQNVSVAYTPVTNAEYNAFLKALGKTPVAPDNTLPVVNVSYNDAVAYCKWMSSQDKTAVYRLPTESE
jgi:toxoflavin biosynthesis protein ToxD